METVVFGGTKSIDFSEIRSQVTRIPEVSIRVREMQAAWDEIVGDGTCLMHQLIGSDKAFLMSRAIKTVLTVAIQLGLYDRYLKRHSQPQYVVGDTQSASSVSVVTGQKTIRDIVSETQSPEVAPQDNALPVSQGMQFPSYQVFLMNHKSNLGEAMESFKEISLQRLLPRLAQEKSVRRIVSIGPGPISLGKEIEYGPMAEVVLLESIDMDPMLSWFWPAVKTA